MLGSYVNLGATTALDLTGQIIGAVIGSQTAQQQADAQEDILKQQIRLEQARRDTEAAKASGMTTKTKGYIASAALGVGGIALIALALIMKKKKGSRSSSRRRRR